jgi:hypothetical protein
MGIGLAPEFTSSSIEDQRTSLAMTAPWSRSIG